MIEHIEELRVQAQSHVLVQRKPFGEIEIAPEEIGTAQRVAAEISELAILHRIPAVARSGAGIDRGNKSVGVQPLNRPRLGHAWDVAVAAIGTAPGTRLANCGPPPCTMPFPLAE